MKKIGLALSGGGFRASLYHLGLVRFLRDAGILSQISHITSVSGGSILSAHLVLNWDRYNGSPSEFDAAASEFLSFVNLDVRNRVVRRFPLVIPFRWPRKLLGRSNRRLTRTGLLEYHYEKYLYGDTSLFEMPERPQLHILATNLSEGCLCSFTRNGLLMVRRRTGSSFHIDPIHIGLATVAMAVAASSAFPGFFPPLELSGSDVGANVGEFGKQAYTDGGVFDNLGIRMFRCLERPLLAETPLSRDDFVDFPSTVEALRLASEASEESSIHRLAHLLGPACHRLDPKLVPDLAPTCDVGPPSAKSENGARDELVLSGLGDLLRNSQLQREPLFAGLKPVDFDAAALLHSSRLDGRALDHADQVLLNRHLLEAAFQKATGRPCFRRLKSGLDGVLVSDVGKPFQVKSNQRTGGLIRTAMRSTDILMDRVWQLEMETFHNASGFVFAPVTAVIEPTEDPTALHPELQRQAATIRTDLDRFSLLEISTLVRHGYCVGRKACRSRPDLFGTDLPANEPWGPVPVPRSAEPQSSAAKHRSTLYLGTGGKGAPAPATVEARALQGSAIRRIWSSLLDYRDWVSYVYVPILVPILILLPYITFKAYQRSHRINQIVESLSQGSRDLTIMTRLLEGPMQPWTGQPAEDVPALDQTDWKGFDIIQDSRIIDMRAWNPTPAGKNDPSSVVYGYRRLKILKRPDHTGNNLVGIDLLPTSPQAQVRFPPQQLQPALRRGNLESIGSGEKMCRWQAAVDFHAVPEGDLVDVIYEHISSGEFLRRGDGWTSIVLPMQLDSAEAIRWFMMPEGKEYRSFRIVRYETGKPEKVEEVKVVTEYLAEDTSIFAYKLISLKAGYTYEVTWYYK